MGVAELLLVATLHPARTMLVRKIRSQTEAQAQQLLLQRPKRVR